jgi:hypothetical protein
VALPQAQQTELTLQVAWHYHKHSRQNWPSKLHGITTSTADRTDRPSCMALPQAQQTELTVQSS